MADVCSSLASDRSMSLEMLIGLMGSLLLTRQSAACLWSRVYTMDVLQAVMGATQRL